MTYPTSSPPASRFWGITEGRIFQIRSDDNTNNLQDLRSLVAQYCTLDKTLTLVHHLSRMEEFLESVKSETKDLFRSKKNLINLLVLVILILALPLSVNLVRQQQIIKSQAAVKSKLSIQTSWQKSGEMEFIETAKPVVVKLLGGFERAGEIKQKSPNTFIVGRIWEPNQPTDGGPEDRAQEWFDRNIGTLSSSNIDCWEGYNEPNVSNDQAVGWIASFEIRRMQLLESIGKKACIGSFSVGTPDFPLWPYFRDAMDYASSRGHYLSLHEYGPTSMSDRAEYFSLRHRRVYQENGFTTPLIITETGIDENGDPNTGGWRAHTDAGDYFNQLKWYDDRLQEDSYVKGATIFSYGLYDWDSFEIYPELVGSDGRSGPLTRYIASGEGGGGGGAPACNPGQVNMSVSPSDGTVGQNMTFNVSGNQGSTHIGDNWSGGVNCAGDFWGSKTCSATTNGSFTWTHFWKNCAPNNCSITSSQCSKLLNFTVGGGGPSNTRLYIDPNPVNLGSNVTAIVTGTISCSTYISTSFGAGLSCDDPNVLTCSQPNPKNDGNPCWWRWACTAGNTAGNYTATFNAAGTNCASSKNYTIVSSTPTKTPTPTPKSTPVSTPTPIPTPTPTSSPTLTLTPTPRPPLSTVFPALPPAQAIYDLNNDLKINSVDVGIFLEDWRNTPSSSNYDFNDDRVRNSIDYAMLAGNLRQ